MILLIDVSDESERAKASLAAQGVHTTETVARTELKPTKLLPLLLRLRKAPPEACYIFCAAKEVQHNRFVLKLLAALTGASKLYFADATGIGPSFTAQSVCFRDTPAFCLRGLYAMSIIASFCAMLLVLSIIIRVKRQIVPSKNAARALCYIKTDFWPGLQAGGSVTHTSEFINAGRSSGFTIEVFASDALLNYGIGDSVTAIKPCEALYDFPAWVSQMEYNLRFPIKVKRRTSLGQFAGVYQRSSVNNVSGVFLSRLLGVPFVLELNTSSKWAANNLTSRNRAFLPSLCENMNFLGAYRIAVVSEVLKRDLEARGVTGDKVFVNPNGVDPTRFGPHVDGQGVRGRFATGTKLVGFIGVFGQWHGVITLMKCVKHVMKEEPLAHFLIIGDGALKSRMIKILEDDGVVENVTFTGLVKHEKAPVYLSACEVLVSPHEDMADGSSFFGSPTKIFEYMSAAKAIVASNVGQLGEILENERDALLVKQRDEKLLAGAIVRLLHDRELRERLGGSARKKVETSYTWRDNFGRVATVLKTNGRA